MNPRALTTFTTSLLLACGPVSPGVEPGTTGDESTTGAPPTTSTPPPTTTLPDTDTTSPTAAETTTEPDPTTGHGFVTNPDFSNPIQCDVFAQDCAPGQKCVPYAARGSSWNSTHCVAVTGDGAPGEPCTAPEGPLAGVDDCALGAYCWDVDANNNGTCIALCLGTPDSPMCPVGSHCQLTGDGVINLCLTSCDPLLQDCPGDDLCTWNNTEFTCALDASGDQGQTNDPCEFINSCDKGLFCLNSEFASAACDPKISGCCQPFCEFPDMPCPNPDQQCLPWYDPMEPIPPGQESIGICAIPQ